MKLARVLGLALLLAVAFRPELPRYAAERRLRVAGEAFRILLTQARAAEDPIGALDRIAELAQSAAPGLWGDPRPWVLAGSAHLSAGRPERALELYGTAFDQSGERAEIDLNIGRAQALLSRSTDARVAFVRAGWISPALIAALPAEAAGPVRAEVARLEEELRRGRLAAPPPAPR